MKPPLRARSIYDTHLDIAVWAPGLDGIPHDVAGFYLDAVLIRKQWWNRFAPQSLRFGWTEPAAVKYFRIVRCLRGREGNRTKNFSVRRAAHWYEARYSTYDRELCANAWEHATELGLHIPAGSDTSYRAALVPAEAPVDLLYPRGTIEVPPESRL